MSRFRKQLLFLCDAFLFAAAVLGYKFITVLLPYTEVGARGSFPKNVLLCFSCYKLRLNSLGLHESGSKHTKNSLVLRKGR